MRLRTATPECRRQIEAVDTRLTASPERIDAVIEGARRGTLALPRLREFARSELKAGSLGFWPARRAPATY